MTSEKIEKKETDKDGNLVFIQNPENYRVDIQGKNNRINIQNMNVGAQVNIHIRGDDNIIEIGRCILQEFQITIGSNNTTRGAKILIGNHFSIEPGGKFELYTSFGEINIGTHCLFSRSITFHFGDSPHLIFDKETGEYTDGDGRISIGNKVWVGEGSYFSKRAVVPNESIVAARSVVTRKFLAPNCVIGGNPSKVVKEGIQWFRNRGTIDKSSVYSDAIDAYDKSVLERPLLAEDDLSEPVASDRSTWGKKWPKDVTCLFGVGAMKAGTSWLHDYLQSHTDVHFGRLKEVHYFDVLDFKSERHHLNSKMSELARLSGALKNAPLDQISQNIQPIENAFLNINIYKNTTGKHDEYREFLLRGRVLQKIVGDITPSYSSLSEERFRDMYGLAPSVKFVFVMRDPIDRLWSAVRMHATQKGGDFSAVCLSVAQDIARNKSHRMLARSGYMKTIQNLEAVAKKEDILFLFYENMFTQSTRDRICDFLDIRKFSGHDSKLVNVGRPHDLPKEIEVLFYKILKPEYNFVLSHFSGRIPDQWYTGIRKEM